MPTWLTANEQEEESEETMREEEDQCAGLFCLMPRTALFPAPKASRQGDLEKAHVESCPQSGSGLLYLEKSPLSNTLPSPHTFLIRCLGLIIGSLLNPCCQNYESGKQAEVRTNFSVPQMC